MDEIRLTIFVEICSLKDRLPRIPEGFRTTRQTPTHLLFDFLHNLSERNVPFPKVMQMLVQNRVHEVHCQNQNPQPRLNRRRIMHKGMVRMPVRLQVMESIVLDVPPGGRDTGYAPSRNGFLSTFQQIS